VFIQEIFVLVNDTSINRLKIMVMHKTKMASVGGIPIQLDC
jgi:hypothetical protein